MCRSVRVRLTLEGLSSTSSCQISLASGSRQSGTSPIGSRTGIKQAELERLWRRLQPLAVSEMPLDAPPPRTSRFGSPLVLSRVHWVRPELIAEVKYLTWTEDNLLRQVVYEGIGEDKPAAEIRRPLPRQGS